MKKEKKRKNLHYIWYHNLELMIYLFVKKASEEIYQQLAQKKIKENVLEKKQFIFQPTEALGFYKSGLLMWKLTEDNS